MLKALQKLKQTFVKQKWNHVEFLYVIVKEVLL